MMPYRIKNLKPPPYLNARVGYLRVPCEKSMMWVVNPANATEYGDRENARKTVEMLQLAKGTYEIEECKGTQRKNEEGGSAKPPPRKPGKGLLDSLFDEE